MSASALKRKVIKMKTAWVVGTRAWNDIRLRCMCLSEKVALDKWNDLRQERITFHENCIKSATEQKCFNDTSERCLEYLQKIDDPKKMNEFDVFDRPFIYELEVCE